MKYGSRSHTNGQHAPISRCCTDSRQASRSAPVHTASISRNLTRSGTIQANSSAISIVSAMLNGDEKRFSRSQPRAPVIAIGGGCGAIAGMTHER